MTERRHEERHAVPEIYKKYITFKARTSSGELVPTKLLDFSRHGIRIMSRLGLSVDSRVECVIAAPKSFSREIVCIGKVKYCIPDGSGGDFIIGVEVVETDDQVGFKLFSKVHDFIKERIGEIF